MLPQRITVKYADKSRLRQAYKIHGNNYFKLIYQIGNYSYSSIQAAIGKDKYLKGLKTICLNKPRQADIWSCVSRHDFLQAIRLEGNNLDRISERLSLSRYQVINLIDSFCKKHETGSDEYETDVYAILKDKINPYEWTTREHQDFISAVKTHGKDFALIPLKMKSKNAQQIYCHLRVFKELMPHVKDHEHCKIWTDYKNSATENDTSEMYERLNYIQNLKDKLNHTNGEL